MEATITPSNIASQQLFSSLAAKHGVKCVEEALFRSENFGDHCHEDEVLLRLGPFNCNNEPEAQNEDF